MSYTAIKAQLLTIDEQFEGHHFRISDERDVKPVRCRVRSERDLLNDAAGVG